MLDFVERIGEVFLERCAMLVVEGADVVYKALRVVVSDVAFVVSVEGDVGYGYVVGIASGVDADDFSS